MSTDGCRANFNNHNTNWQQWWLYQPTILVTNLVLWPTYQMSMAEQLNTLTRLLVLIVIILYLLNYKDLGLYLLIIGIMLIIFTGLILQNNTNKGNENVVSKNENRIVNQQVPIISHLQVYNNNINDNWASLKAYNKK